MNQWLESHRGYLLVLLVNLAATAGVVFTLRRPTQGLVEILPPPTITPAPTSTLAPTPTPVVLRVYVSGAVASPDVYSLPGGSRIEQAIEAAGGFAGDAAEASINLAQPLVDGEQVYVPNVEEAVAPAPGAAMTGSLAGASAPASNPGQPININTASVDELTELPGIGPAIADRIVEYRQGHGSFRVVEDIKQVKGIGDATLEKLQDLITVR